MTQTLSFGSRKGETRHKKGASKTARPANTTTGNEAPAPLYLAAVVADVRRYQLRNSSYDIHHRWSSLGCPLLLTISRSGTPFVARPRHIYDYVYGVSHLSTVFPAQVADSRRVGISSTLTCCRALAWDTPKNACLAISPWRGQGRGKRTYNALSLEKTVAASHDVSHGRHTVGCMHNSRQLWLWSIAPQLEIATGRKKYEAAQK